MNTTLLESVKSQLIKRTDAGALNTGELIHILEIESRYSVPETQCNSVPTQAKTQCVNKEPVPQPEQTATENVVSIETEKSEEQEAPKKELTPTEKQKLEISEKIVELGGTPPEKGSLAKFKQALADIESSTEEDPNDDEVSTDEESEVKEETTTEESEEEDIDQFNDLMDEAQNLYDELEEKDIVDMEQVVEIIQKIDSEANSPDELDLANLKKFVKKLKKLNK